MISTPISCTSDYYSGSDFDYDDDVVKAAPQHHCSLNDTNIILQTLIQNQYQQSSSNISSTNKIQQSIQLLKLVQKYDLSNEIFIRANAILHKFLLSTKCVNNIDVSILIACLSLSTKLSQHSTHSSIPLFNSDSLILNENMICNALEWDIDMITPINYIEAMLLHVTDSSIKARVRELTYELIVLCLIDVRCIDLSSDSLAMSCLLMTSELLDCCEIIPKQIFLYIQDKNSLFETSLIFIRQILLNISSKK
ncbi:unnamed protein product [Adineta steineri]|uniref:Cyclin N-terminal domain-containing protein n=1 Tax=Adineta steineri TaxID=433720 RepID=A0A813MCC7_9BILA|nr:unnamed protein product [Adineta steineri]CAF3692493.1 unnamed protein product [Adineta steineri]